LQPLLAIMFAPGRFAMILIAQSDDLHLETDSEFRIPSTMTEEEFVEWSQTHEKVRVEWMNGEVISMSPASARHILIFGWLYHILDIYVQERALGTVLGSEFLMQLQTGPNRSWRMPDLMFVQKVRSQLIKKNHLEGPPDLAIEIVSPDSIKRDWSEKLMEYEAAGIQEYWIIDPLTQRFEAFKLDTAGHFQPIYNLAAGRFASQVVTGFHFQVEWLWQPEFPSVLTVLRNLGLIS
jgi:Uma2 family endonuclease